MKVALITYHFPPQYNAGGEKYMYQLAKYLLAHGHVVEVVTIESTTEKTLEPRCTSEIYQQIPVNRLFLNLKDAPNLFELTYRNPYLGKWIREYLQRTRPELVHYNSGYLLGGTVIEAANELKIPSVLTLHEYWFLCPNFTLFRPDGQNCEDLCPPSRCAWVQLRDKRRYRVPERLSGYKLGKAVEQLSRSKAFLRASGFQCNVNQIEDRRQYLKRVFDKVDVLLSPSQFLIQKFQDFGFDASRIKFQPLGLEMNPSLKSETSHIQPRKEFHIGYMGQFAYHKGIHDLIRAFQKLKKAPGACKLLLYGKYAPESPYGRRLQALSENSDEIIFQGAYDNSMVAQVLDEIDVLVVPSIWYENRPYVILEAQAMGKPVIASRIGGMVELIEDDKNGLLFETGNVDDLARQLQRLIDSPMLLSRLQAGIEPVYSQEDEMTSIMATYQSLIQPKQIST